MIIQVLLFCASITSASLHQSFDLVQDESGQYFFTVFVGSLMSRRLLLVDTLANGTCISYDPTMSKRSTINTRWTQTVSMEQEGSFFGRMVQDDLCLDDDQDICIEHFNFFNTIEEQQLEKYSIDYDGVIPFNRYGMPITPNDRLVNVLDFEDILSNGTMQLDLSLPPSMFVSAETAPVSKVILNGADVNLIKYKHEEGQGVLYRNNTLENSLW